MDYANIILEMLDRIKTLEQEVASLKSLQKDVVQNKQEGNSFLPNGAIATNYYSSTGNKRDTTRYLFDGNVYSKNRLVLAVVKFYVVQHSSITKQDLKDSFPKRLQGSIGVVENVEIARISRSDYNVRFFTRPEEVIHLSDGDMYVCTQWGIGNIPEFVDHVKNKIGYRVEEIR